MSESTLSAELQNGIEAVRSGRRLLARLHLSQAAATEPQDDKTWLWLAWVAESPAAAVAHLERALACNPDNEIARAALMWAGVMADWDFRTPTTPRHTLEAVALYESPLPTLPAEEPRVAFDRIDELLPTPPEAVPQPAQRPTPPLALPTIDQLLREKRPSPDDSVAIPRKTVEAERKITQPSEALFAPPPAAHEKPAKPTALEPAPKAAAPAGDFAAAFAGSEPEIVVQPPIASAPNVSTSAEAAAPVAAAPVAAEPAEAPPAANPLDRSIDLSASMLDSSPSVPDIDVAFSAAGDDALAMGTLSDFPDIFSSTSPDSLGGSHISGTILQPEPTPAPKAPPAPPPPAVVAEEARPESLPIDKLTGMYTGSVGVGSIEVFAGFELPPDLAVPRTASGSSDSTGAPFPGAQIVGKVPEAAEPDVSHAADAHEPHPSEEMIALPTQSVETHASEIAPEALEMKSDAEFESLPSVESPAIAANARAVDASSAFNSKDFIELTPSAMDMALGSKADVQLTPDGEPRKVLIVDDSPTVCKIVSITLKKRGFQVATAGDGVEAMSMISADRPDLILLDITMPRMDGYQLCKLIKGYPETKNIPVIMLSGKDGFFDRVRGKLVGCSDYITKPFDPELLVATVERFLPVEVAVQ